MENTSINTEQAPRPEAREAASEAPSHDAEQAIGRLGLDSDVASLVMEIIDEQVKNADIAGYRRGRNEKIELLTRPLDPVTEADLESDAATPHFPRYTRRSVWDT